MAPLDWGGDRWLRRCIRPGVSVATERPNIFAPAGAVVSVAGSMALIRSPITSTAQPACGLSASPV
jgi:hypothetical protein